MGKKGMDWGWLGRGREGRTVSAGFTLRKITIVCELCLVFGPGGKICVAIFIFSKKISQTCKKEVRS